MTKTQKKVGVVGTGYWGKNLVRNFSEIGALDAICDENITLANEHQKQYNIKNVYTDYHQLINNPDIDAIVIATPAITHHAIAKESLLAGKDVFVEKPLALNTHDAKELIELAQSQQRILMVDHILQFHPAIEKLKELIDTGSLGKLEYIYSNRLNIGKLRHEENILWSFAPHDISVILGLANKEPSKIDAVGQAYLQDEVCDTTITHLTFSNRLRAHIYVSWLHPFKEQKLVIIGDKCMAVFDDTSKEEKLVLYPHKIEWINQIPVAAKADKEVVALEPKEPLKEACLHFLHCMETRENPRTDGNEGLAVLSVLETAQKQLDSVKNES